MNQKYNHIFDTSHLQSDMKKRSLQSGAITLSSQVIMFVLQLGSTMILARILSPRDYGINAMAISITGFAGMFSHLGLSTAIVQKENINHDQVSTLFWINALIGIMMMLIVAAISPVAAWFYKTPEMFLVMLSMSIIFAINGLSVQHSALLIRQMRFLSIAKIDITSLLAGIVVALITGYYGFGYWALVFNSLTNSAVHTIGCWFCCKWLPGRPIRNAGVSSMIKFGFDLIGFNVINYFARNLDNVLIGRYYGSFTLGLYDKAYQLLMMPIRNIRDPLTNVALPALSRLQKEPEQYRNYYLKCVSLLAFVSMPLVTFMFFFSDRIIYLLLGPQWGGASDIFKILAIAALMQPVASTVGMVLISTGRTRLYLIMGAINAIVISFSFLAGLHWGAKGVATGYAVANYLIMLPQLFYTFKDTSINIQNFFYSVFKPLFASLVMGGGCFLLVRLIGNINVVVTLAISSLVSSLIYLLIFAIFPSGMKNLHDYYAYSKLIFNRK